MFLSALLRRLIGEDVTGTITHPSGLLEVDALEVTPDVLTDYPVLLLFVNALTQITTIRIKIKDNVGTYRLLNSAVYPTDFPASVTAVPITLYPLSVPWKISLQSAVAEGVQRSIPYRYVKKVSV